MDTGSGLDLLGKCDVPRSCLPEPVDPLSFHTANGSVDVTSTAAVPVPELFEHAHPYVLEDTPAVLSIGLRCMEHGYQYVWPPRSALYFVLPCGQVVPFEVHNNIPYLLTDSSASRAAAAPAVRRPPWKAPAKT